MIGPIHWKDARRLRKHIKKKIYAVWLPDEPKFTRIFVNARYCAFFGVEPNEVIGREATSETVEELKGLVAKKLRQVVAEKTTLISTEKVLLRSGETALLRWVDMPIVDDSGKVIEIHSVGDPIEERRQHKR